MGQPIVTNGEFVALLCENGVELSGVRCVTGGSRSHLGKGQFWEF